MFCKKLIRISLCLLWVLTCQSVRCQEQRKPTDKPNFVLIMADDLGFADLSIHGSKQIPTPNIDRLATSGVNFSQAYVSAPVCAPSRAGIMTGRNQVKFGFDNNLAGNQPGFDPEFKGLPLTETTIAQRLKAAGYVTGLIGKWHLGDADQFHPLKRGFDEFWGYRGGGHSYFSKAKGLDYEPGIESNFKKPAPITYITDDKGDESVAFIERHKDRPFFLFASFNAPHTPMQALEKDLARFQYIKNKKRRTYAAMVHRLDINVGKILDKIESAGISENTVVVFISDNGGPADQNSAVNAPYNGQKGILLEGGIHVPMFLSWKNSLSANLVYHQPVSSLDLAATFCALAGVDTRPEELDGVNLMPFIKDESIAAPHQSLLWRFTISAAIREGDWKLVRLPDRLPLLYHLPTDSSEQKNRALENPQLTEYLLKQLGEWDVQLPHPVFLEGAVWKFRQLKLYDRPYQLTQPKKD